MFNFLKGYKESLSKAKYDELFMKLNRGELRESSEIEKAYEEEQKGKKPSETDSESESESSDDETVIIKEVPKKRGRPKKNPLPEKKEETTTPKKRGRPKKNPEPEPTPIKLTSKRGRKPNLEAQKKKAEEAEKKEKEKKAKLEKNAKIYWGLDALPKYHRRPTPEEAVKKNHVGWWGKNKIDAKLLEYDAENDPVKLNKERKPLQVKLSGILGKINILKKKVDYNKRNNKEYKDLEDELATIKNEGKLISEKIKAIDAKIKANTKGEGLYTTNTDDDYSSH